MEKPNRHFQILLFLFFLLFSTLAIGQIHDKDNWCRLNCDPKIDKENANRITTLMSNDSLMETLDTIENKIFPIRFVYVKENNVLPSDSLGKELDEVIHELNEAYAGVGFIFEIEKIEILVSTIKLEELSQNQFELYDKFSKENDEENIITVYILDHKNEFCRITANSISCGRIGGFSYILSSRNNNVVLSQFDLNDPKIVAHEFGHFFGLYHTFEESLFGKDKFSQTDCQNSGDRICDTPPDPGTIFELYVNYSTCEMIGFKDENENEYKPILENYMSYYKPCYLKKYSFTKDQEMVMKLAGELPIRKRLSKRNE